MPKKGQKMKKIYFCVLFTLTMMCADAQHDTLKIGALVISKAATTETSSWKEIVNGGDFKNVKVKLGRDNKRSNIR